MVELILKDLITASQSTVGRLEAVIPDDDNPHNVERRQELTTKISEFVTYLQNVTKVSQEELEGYSDGEIADLAQSTIKYQSEFYDNEGRMNRKLVIEQILKAQNTQ